MNDIVKIILTAVVSALVTGVITYTGVMFKLFKAFKKGMLSLLRAEIIRSHDKYSKKEYCPIYAKDALGKAYSAYHDLGGNGTITNLFNETMSLPTEPAADGKE